MNVLVTGANGHIGNHVVRACLAAGMKPAAMVRPGSDRRALAGLDVEIREGDIVDAASVDRAVHDVEIVFHVAAVHRNWSSDESTFMRPAVEGTRNVLDAAKRAGVRRVVCTSSGATVGFASDPSHPLDESATNAGGKNVYTRAKIAGEGVALEAARERGQDVVITNPSGVFGPRDYRLTPATRGIIGLLQGDPSFFALCFTDVRDVAQGHVLAATKGRSGERYVLTGDMLLPPQVCELFAKETGIRPRAMLPPKFLLRWIAGAAERRARKTGEDAAVTRDAVDDVYGRHLAYDATRARSELGATFRPAGDVLRDAVRWVLFMDALKPKVAARARAAMGAAAAPDPDWTR